MLQRFCEKGSSRKAFSSAYKKDLNIIVRDAVVFRDEIALKEDKMRHVSVSFEIENTNSYDSISPD